MQPNYHKTAITFPKPTAAPCPPPRSMNKLTLNESAKIGHFCDMILYPISSIPAEKLNIKMISNVNCKLLCEKHFIHIPIQEENRVLDSNFDAINALSC